MLPFLRPQRPARPAVSGCSACSARAPLPAAQISITRPRRMRAQRSSPDTTCACTLIPPHAARPQGARTLPACPRRRHVPLRTPSMPEGEGTGHQLKTAYGVSVVVPGPNSGLGCDRRNNDTDTDARRWRILDFLIPLPILTYSIMAACPCSRRPYPLSQARKLGLELGRRESFYSEVVLLVIRKFGWKHQSGTRPSRLEQPGTRATDHLNQRSHASRPPPSGPSGPSLLPSPAH